MKQESASMLQQNKIEMEPQEITIEVLGEKYAKGKEKTPTDVRMRVAKALAKVEKNPQIWEPIFLKNMENGFVPAGRINSAAGMSLHATLINCFVQPVGDCISGFDNDDYPSIYTALAEAAETMRRGGGVGYDFSHIRPLGALVKGTQSRASGPLSYMRIFDRSCETVESAGCFAGDTLINTDRGLVTIKEIVEHPETEYQALTHLGYRKITARFNNGEKKLYEVNTQYGFSVKVTDGHKFAQFENGSIITKPLKDIRKSNNQKLLISAPINFGLSGEWNNDTRLAYLTGAFLGNGCWRHNEQGISGILIANNITKFNVAIHIEKLAIELGLNPILDPRNFENCIEVRIFNTKFFNNLKAMGVDKGNELKVPDFILASSKEEQAAFIAGLFDADGSVSETKSNIRLRMISDKLLKQVQVMLVGLGVVSKFNLEREAFENWKPIYCLGIFGTYAQRAFSRTVSPYSVQKLKERSSRDRVGYGHYWDDVAPFGYIKNNFTNHWSGNVNTNPKVSMNALMHSCVTPELVNTVTAEITSVIDLGVETVYDLEVDEVHLLSGNGLYTSNSRRGAQMGVMRCDHPDIVDFINAKKTKGEFNNFNLSIGVTDAFMKAVETDSYWQLVHKVKPGKEYAEENNSYYDGDKSIWIWKNIKARDLWELVMQSTYNHAEPGILFLDQMNRENNLYYCEVIEATNPCAEQPLPPYGCCCLGSINLTMFVRNPFTTNATFDIDSFKECIKTSVRMLDNVLDSTEWPLDKQYQEAMNKRRIGLGFLGLGDAIMMMGTSYNKEDGVLFAKQISEVLRDSAYEASIDLAKEKGAFPLFDAEKYLAGEFISRLPSATKDLIKEHGIRNSHLLSIAPTGTITLAFADNASNGIEPPFSWTYDRKKRMDDGSMKSFEVADYAWRLYRAMGGDTNNLPKNFVTALEMSVASHVDIMKAVQPYIDTSISKTVNIPADYPYEDFKDLYIYAWKSGLKGLATYRPNDTLGSILSVKEEPKPISVASVISENTIDIDNGKSLEQIVDEMYSQSFESREDGSLSGTSVKGRFHTDQGEQKFIITINFINLVRNTRFGKVSIRRPVEFILTSNFTTSSSSWDATMRCMSLMGRSGVSITKVIENLREITWGHGTVRYGNRIKDGKSVPLWHSSDAAAIGFIIEEELKKEGFLTENGKLANYCTLETEFGTLISDKTIQLAPVEIISETNNQANEVTTIKVAMHGKKCKSCGANAVVKRDGCEICDACGEIGSCG